MILRHLYITEKQLKNLEKESKEKEIKVSEVVRRIFDKYFEEKERLKNESREKR